MFHADTVVCEGDNCYTIHRKAFTASTYYPPGTVAAPLVRCLGETDTNAVTEGTLHATLWHPGPPRELGENPLAPEKEQTQKAANKSPQAKLVSAGEAYKPTTVCVTFFFNYWKKNLMSCDPCVLHEIQILVSINKKALTRVCQVTLMEQF